MKPIPKPSALITLTGSGIGLGFGIGFQVHKNCGFDRIFQSILHTGIETQNLDWIFGFYTTMVIAIVGFWELNVEPKSKDKRRDELRRERRGRAAVLP